jgi:hypothetical protein
VAAKSRQRHSLWNAKFGTDGCGTFHFAPASVAEGFGCNNGASRRIGQLWVTETAPSRVFGGKAAEDYSAPLGSA